MALIMACPQTATTATAAALNIEIPGNAKSSSSLTSST